MQSIVDPMETEEVEARAEVADEGVEMSDEDLLGEATLAKLKSGAYLEYYRQWYGQRLAEAGRS